MFRSRLAALKCIAFGEGLIGKLLYIIDSNGMSATADFLMVKNKVWRVGEVMLFHIDESEI
ncbi:MAG: hypothetical protein CMM58_04265 [Rhodospirillaceae bacterium]|nr:hypothetical protein [Rhodospirillaceae bacterium]